MLGITALSGRLGREERGRDAARCGGDRGGAPAQAKQRRGKKGRGRGGRLTSGAGVSVGDEKRERGWRGSGSLGRKVRLISFFFFSFCKPFSIQFFFKSNSNQNPSNFSQNFINLLDFTQATKNYAKPNNDAQTLVVSKLIKLN
jgi:hypothetical protein